MGEWDSGTPVDRLIILLRYSAPGKTRQELETLRLMLVERLRERGSSQDDIDAFLLRSKALIDEESGE